MQAKPSMGNSDSRAKPRHSKTWSGEGIDFVRCRICGDHRRVISARHLSKHGIERETYMNEYRLSPDELIAKDFRRIQSSRPGYQPHGKREWIAAMKQLYEANGNVSLKYLQTRYAYLYEQGRWIFGDSDQALRAVGLKPGLVRLREQLDQDKVVKQIRTLRARKIPLNAKYVLRNHPGTFSGGRRLFGSWSKAVSASEIAVPKNTKGGRLGMLRALRWIDKHSRADIPQELKLQGVYYFGSVAKAIDALKTERRILLGWSTRKLIALIQRLHRAKENLSYAAARRNHPAEVSAAEAYLGSWGNALHAAGIDLTCIFTVSGANERCPPKEIVLAMAMYLNRPFPRCKDYLGVMLREHRRTRMTRFWYQDRVIRE